MTETIKENKETKKEENTQKQEEEILLDDTRWEEILEATDGAASACFQCGTCTATCPWTLVKKDPVSVRHMIRKIQLGLQGPDEDLWLCTTCAACEEMCPRGVKISDVIKKLRRLSWKKGKVPKGMSSLMWALYFDKNPFRLPPSEKANWAKELKIKKYTEKDEILLFIGNAPSYDKRAQKTAKALVKVFGAANVKFGTLGDKEPGCGEEVLDVGLDEYVCDIVNENMKIFEDNKVHTIVTVSPHCYDIFRNHYPKGKFKVMHYTQYLKTLIDEGRLKFKKKYPYKVAFQDPCYLGRRNKEYEAPREVLRAMSGLELVELPHTKETGICCGGGGGRMFLETKAGERFSDLRIHEAADAKTQVLATACPSCLACLEDSTKILPKANIKVQDLAEIAAEAV
ncbi:(Fe-S)-binding protein [Elusimicrobiota bacterium]